MMLTGLIMLGLTLVALSFNTLDFSPSTPGEEVFGNIGADVEVQAETLSQRFSGRDFVENFQAASFNYRNRVSASGDSLYYIVVLGEREGSDMNVYAANLGSSERQVEVEVNDESFSFLLEGDRIETTVFEPERSYSVTVETEDTSESFEVFDNRFIFILYSYSGEGVVRQDTYTG